MMISIAELGLLLGATKRRTEFSAEDANMPKPVSRKNIILKKRPKEVRLRVIGKAQLGVPPPRKHDRSPIKPFSEEGSTLTEAEIERSKNVKAEELGYKGQVRFVQGGAAGTKG